MLKKKLVQPINKYLLNTYTATEVVLEMLKILQLTKKIKFTDSWNFILKGETDNKINKMQTMLEVIVLWEKTNNAGNKAGAQQY